MRRLLLCLFLLAASVAGWAQPQLYWSRSNSGAGGQIKRSNLDGTGTVTLVSGANELWSLEMDGANRKLYFLDNQEIKRSNLDGSSVQVVRAETAQDIALDLTNNRIYWAGANNIYRASLSGGAATLIHTGTEYIYGLALDLGAERLYFADHGPGSPNTGQIRYLSLTGSFPATGTTVLTTNGTPTAMVRDGSHLYFTDYTLGTVERVGTDGSGRVTVTGALGSNVDQVAIDPATKVVYVAGYDSGEVHAFTPSGPNSWTQATSPISGQTRTLGALVPRWAAATTNAATAVTNATATLNGTVNASGLSTVVTFEYGLSASYGSTATVAASPVTGSSDTSVSANLSSLSMGTTYHFRVKAVNAEGTVYGADQTFTTPTLTSTTTTLGSSANPSTYGQSVTLTATVVAGATGTVTFWDGASSIGTGTLNGSGVATVSLTSLTAGTHSLTAVYSGDPTYAGSTSSVLSQVVNKATPTVSTWPTASDISYGQTLAGSTLTGGSGSVAGSFVFTSPGTAPGVGTASQGVTFTPSDTTNYNTVASTVSVTVLKANPTVSTWPTASGITYGQTLASSSLSGGSASVTGSFTFTSPSTAPTAGTASQGVTFTPTDTTNYNTVAGTVSVTVAKATPTISTPPTAAGITYGQTLADATLSGGSASVGGMFAFTTPGTAPNAGTASHGVTFTPTDATNYATATVSVSVTVSKATPTVSTWPTASNISYGQTLASSTLSGGSGSVVGAFTFTTTSTAPAVGTAAQGVTFTPTDSANYNTVAGTVNVTVIKATPTVTTWPTASGITYGQTLASSSLSGGSGSVAGAFAFTTLSTAPNAGTAPQDVTFTPTDITNYNTVAGTVSVTVAKVTPTITTLPTAAGITYGQTLASATLSGGGASVPGNFAFTTPSTAPSTGTANHGVTFTPSDTTNYNTATGSVSVTVSKANPTVSTWPTASGITYGQTLASSSLSGGSASVTGSFAFTSPSTAPNAGTASQGVTFTPTDTTNYNTVAGAVSVTVAKATPTISTPPTAAGITYGQTLADATLSGGSASVGGMFTFTTPGTAPNAGTASHGVTFTPTDATNYATATVSVSVTVSKATPTVSTWPTASNISYGQTLASSTLSGGSGSVVGAFAFTTTSTTPAVGTAAQGVTFTPTDTSNYNTVAGTVNVTVIKATPTVTTWPTASAITYGQTLASSSLSGGSGSVAGAFAFTTPSTAPSAGTASQGVTFIPTDTTNYNSVAGTVSVTVNKATPTISTLPTAAGITYGQTLASATLSGGGASVPGSFAFTTPSTAPSTGTANYGVTFTPSDTTNYNTATGSVSVTVSKANPTVSTWPTASGITYGQTLASSSLSGGSASVTGAFAFTSLFTAPNAGTASQGVTFTPTDTTNYNTVVGTVSVTVAKATPTITTWPTASAITYGQTLASSTLTGGSASVAGAFAFTAPSTAPIVGNASQGVTFTPTDASNYNTVAGSVSVTVNQASTTTTLSSSANPSGFTQSITLTATVTPGATGTVTFKDGAATLGTGTLTGGNATFVTSALAVGGHALTAVYGGDSNHLTSTSSSLVQTVVLYAISGSTGTGGVSLAYTDGTPKTVTSGSDGTYTVSVPYDWSGTITPTKTGYTFSAAKSYTQVRADVSAQNYTVSLDPPTTPTFGSITTTGFTASWTGNSAATGYLVDVATEDTFASPVQTNLSTTGTSLAITSLNPGTTYHFRMRATDGTLTSANVASAAILTLPAAPVALAATGLSATTFTANWQAVTGATGYKLTVATSDDFSSILSGYNAKVVTGTSEALSGLATGTTFYYRLVATNATGDGPVSNTVMVALIPLAPVATAATAVTSTGFTAQWQASAGATGYRLDVARDAGFTDLVAGYANLDAGNTTSRDVAGLLPNRSYHFRVRATNAAGTSPSSNAVEVRTRSEAPSVETLPVSELGVDGATLRGLVTANNQTTTVSFELGTDLTFGTTLAATPGTVSGMTATAISVRATGLIPRTRYYVRAVGTNATGMTKGEVLSFTTPSNPLTLRSVNPGAAAIGALVTLSGSGFTGTTSVVIGGMEAVFIVVSDTEILAVVPPGARSGGVRVTSPSGTTESTSPLIVKTEG